MTIYTFSHHQNGFSTTESGRIFSSIEKAKSVINGIAESDMAYFVGDLGLYPSASFEWSMDENGNHVHTTYYGAKHNMNWTVHTIREIPLE